MTKKKQPPKGELSKAELDEFISCIDSALSRDLEKYKDHPCHGVPWGKVRQTLPECAHHRDAGFDVHVCRLYANRIDEDLIHFGCFHFQAVTEEKKK